jgi:hypothetical protein
VAIIYILKKRGEAGVDMMGGDVELGRSLISGLFLPYQP